MPYKNIIFIKLEKRLLHDYRWLKMSQPAQLLYIKLILAAAEGYNQLPTCASSLALTLRWVGRHDYLMRYIKEVKSAFPKFKETSEYYYFEDFEEKTNWLPTANREFLGKSHGTPREIQEKDKEKEEDKEGVRPDRHCSLTGKQPLFAIPTISEIKEYCAYRKNKVDAERFFDFYTGKGWMIGKNKMRDWKACVRTWEAKKEAEPERKWLNEDP